MINSERLIDLLMERKLSQSELARRIGLTQSAISNIIKRGSGSSHIHKIARELGTTPEYLLGETDDPAASVVTDRQFGYRGEPVDSDLVEIEQIDLRYGMGGTYADNPVEVERRQFSREWLRSFTRASPAALTWALGDGDSMEPTIRSGEVILIDRSQDTPRMGDGIWACALGDIGMIKRLRYLPGGTVELHSDNPLVRPQIAADGELHVVGRVIAVVRRL